MKKSKISITVGQSSLKQALAALHFRARMCDGHNAASKRLKKLCNAAVSDICTAMQTSVPTPDKNGPYPEGAYCLNPDCGRTFTTALCCEYGFGEGDQPDTCPTCGARIEPAGIARGKEGL